MIHIEPINAFSDNYIWAISDSKQKHYVIVDPGEATPVLDFLKKKGAQLTAILITHHHHDHVGGIADLLKAFPDTKVYSPAKERIPHSTHPLNDADNITIEAIDLSFTILFIPGHTAGHIAYYRKGMIFCGDTLFAGGCGRVFDGTHLDLYESLQKIAQLPPETLIYCAHEYTLDNIGFGLWVEPDNPKLLQRQTDTYSIVDNDQPTVPSTLTLELATNPFLRTHLPHIIKRVEEKLKKPMISGDEVFKALRIWKDQEYD
ncbi:MAG: hydroxyacylglutathione hydrolase [Thiotrichaceae bacterium]|nr:hydroxyacylglutathione hydrolase [Thiotrichaceae bacterium]